ncbi:MAG: hypothetical protein GY909_15980 [Oligoflexia bacterium]|nr:hypothetical protein [Oligoflexia bacterium]
MSEKGLSPVDYDIKFASETNQFCIDSANKLVSHAISTMGLDSQYWDSVKELIRDVEAKFEEFNKGVSKEKSTPVKIILYTLDLDSETSSKWENIATGGRESEIIPHIRFGFRVVNKMMCGDHIDSYTIEDEKGSFLPTFDQTLEEKEIPYSEEAFKTLNYIRENIIDTSRKLKDFFSEDEANLLKNITILNKELLENTSKQLELDRLQGLVDDLTRGHD